MTERISRRAVIAVFVLSAALRLVLALVNQEANDDHLTAINIIRNEHRLPYRNQCWECFQPKLYHVTAAAALSARPHLSASNQIRILNTISCAAGIATLLLLLSFIRHITSDPRMRVSLFALTALNPELIGISSQATNDAFVIFFATLSLFGGFLFFTRFRWRHFWYMTGGAALAALAKGNGVVVALAVVAAFTVLLIRPPRGRFLNRRAIALRLGAFCSVLIILVPIPGQYVEHWQRFGSPFVTNQKTFPLPDFFTETPVARPGITSVVDGFFTFRFISLLRDPVLTDDTQSFPRYRTSLWTQLYGHAHFVHFAGFPPSWRNTGRWVIWLGRTIFIVALVPTALLGIGVFVRIRKWYRVAVHRGDCSVGGFLLDLAVGGFIAFQIYYAALYRDFAVMKAIFIFPAFVGFIYLLHAGWAAVERRLSSAYPKLVFPLHWVAGLLAVLYTIDISLLIYHLV